LAVPGLPLIQAGDDLAGLIVERLDAQAMRLQPDDVVVVAQKIVSKSEGCLVDLTEVTPSPRALALAQQVDKDPRLVELILSESRRIVRHRKDVLIVEHRLGLIMANAGVDQSNVAGADSGRFALTLPTDPDASADRLRAALIQKYDCTVAVIINDSFGRPWRRGAVGVAIGCAGLQALADLRGQPDLFGRSLRVSEVAQADEIAAAASLLMGQAAEALPVVILRGLALKTEGTTAASLIRSSAEDLFR
jgi:coenzyme F420-0:L-glutamate ligase/coenzyme F420-1:gamma-L-glutamate ligase